MSSLVGHSSSLPNRIEMRKEIMEMKGCFGRSTHVGDPTRLHLGQDNTEVLVEHSGLAEGEA